MNIPEEVKNIMRELESAGYEAFIVGGCVRDLLMSQVPTDWDVATNAKPEEVQKIFSASAKASPAAEALGDTSADEPDSFSGAFYENKFGTVGVKTSSEDKSLKIVEVTTYRTESKYTDKRHPDQVKFADSIQEDLKRRDFTINAIAMDKTGKIKDFFSGQDDIKSKKIRAVGNPEERFSEDALRLLRAVRFATTLNFEIEKETLEATKKNSKLLKIISKERIRDEFLKIIGSKEAAKGVELLRETGLIEQFIPELSEGVGVDQNLHHIYTVWEHDLRALKYAADQNYSIDVRIAALFHDIGKPRTKRGEGKYATFYGHDVVGAKMAVGILERLKFPKKQVEKIVTLVRRHLFYYNVGEVTESSVRRLLAQVGQENIEELVQLREADRIGSGVPKAKPYKLRHFEYMIDKVSADPISVKMLAIDGNDLMKEVELEPGPKIGLLLSSLLAKVLDDPKLNTKEKLTELAQELNKQNEKELRQNLERIEKEIEKEEEERRKKYYV